MCSRRPVGIQRTQRSRRPPERRQPCPPFQTHGVPDFPGLRFFFPRWGWPPVPSNSPPFLEVRLTPPPAPPPALVPAPAPPFPAVTDGDLPMPAVPVAFESAPPVTPFTVS